METLHGHFDGRTIVLDQPPPPELRPNTPVEIRPMLDPREQSRRELLAFLSEFWSRPLPPGFEPSGRAWRREDLYERGGEGPF